MKHRTLMIGLDGATFSVLDPLMDQGEMPFLRSFVTEGARAKLRTIVPALTPPAWTSLVTGRRPGQHGVFDFFRMESPDTKVIRFFSSHDVGCDTIWSLASDAGLRVTSLNYPAMFPPPRINGYVVPGWIPWKQLRLACWPEDVFSRLKQIPGFNARELAMDFNLEQQAVEGVEDKRALEPWVELHTRREENWFQVFRQLEEDDPSELTAILFDGVDKLQHLCWRFLCPPVDQPLREPWEFRVRDAAIGYFRKLDSILERMCSIIGDEATVVMASDHGFGPHDIIFHVNAWLQQKGYLRWTENADCADTKDAVLGVNHVARHTFNLDWNKTKAYATTPTSNGIYINLKNGNGSGNTHSVGDYEALRRRLIDELMQVQHPKTGKPIVEKIWTREEAFPGPYSDAAPDLTLVMADGGLVSILPGKKTVSMRPNVNGAHRPVGVFFARGPEIQSGREVEELSILDVAPFVLHCLGLGVPAEMEGRIREDIFVHSALRKRPAKVILEQRRARQFVGRRAFPATQLAAEDEAAILERMRQMGYIE